MTAQKHPLIYLDNNATTRIDPAVVEAMMPFLTEQYFNPSSAYHASATVAKALEHAREQLATLLGCDAGEVFFTSCGTESNNAAINSALLLDPDRQHVITTSVEHSSIKTHCETLARRGHEVTWLGVGHDGRIDLAELERAIRPDTAIVSIMWANNETGVLSPVDEIAALCHKKRVLFHTDAVQAVGKIQTRLAHSHINFLALSGHKLHCPKGVGALYVSKRTKFNPFILGGGQEKGKRAGTENVASIVALGKACEIAGEFMTHENTEVRALRDEFECDAMEKIGGAQINGSREHRLPNTTSIAFEGLDSEPLLKLLDKHGVCCSAGSACTAGSLHPSHVLTAMGFSTERARASLRFSFGRFNTKAETELALDILVRSIAKLRETMLAA
jgi:cysteine desulfurase